MRIAVIGAGGSRTPQLVETFLRQADRIHLDCLSLMDTNPGKLAIMGGLCRQIARETSSRVELHCTGNAVEALDQAKYVITTLRVGEERGRILDERIALNCGVLGQETTGAGGFAMAMRSIPTLLEYAELVQKLNPGAWIINFTNPAGLVIQALHDRGYARAIGICDSANGARKAVEAFLRVPAIRLRDQVFGLNHLSWTRSVSLEGDELLPGLLQDDGFLSSSKLRLFEPALVKRIGMYLNEYLFYYYHPELALGEISRGKKTRGEEIEEWNRALLDRLSCIDLESHGEEALKVYRVYRKQRSASYMDYNLADGSFDLVSSRLRGEFPTRKEITGPGATEPGENARNDMPDEGGYAGVALEVIDALEGGQPALTAVNFPNGEAIRCMKPEDVVEVSCRIDTQGVHPLPIGEIPEHQELLMRSVKRFERLSLEAIGTRSRIKATEAMMAHPLVLSFSLASRLVEEYIRAHAAYVGNWGE